MRKNNGTRRILRKALAMLLAAALLLSAGAALGEDALRGYTKDDGYVYLHLGRYPQTADGGIEPILWRVLSVEDGKAYLLSEYILFARAMHTHRGEYANFTNAVSSTALCA